MSASREKQMKIQELVWQGELNVHRIAELKSELQQALKVAKQVRIRFEAVDEVDISLLQLLCSGHRTAGLAGKELVIVGDVPDCFTQTLRLAGFNRHTGCKFSASKSCLWKTEYERDLAGV